MRLLELHNPDVQFDWARLLKEAPSDSGVRRERERERDPRERDRRERRGPRGGPRPLPSETTSAAAVPPALPRSDDQTAEIADERAEAHAAIVLEESRVPDSVAVSHGEPLAADHAEYLEYAEAAAHSQLEPGSTGGFGVLEEPGEPEPGEPEPEEPVSAAVGRLGADTVTRLRARYAQLVSRIAEKPVEDEVRAELNARAERLNPDAWRTADEVAAALEQYESVFESLRADVGHHRRR